MCLCLFTCVCECARACACAQVYVTYTQLTISHILVCVCVRVVDDSLYCKAAPFSMCCVHLAVLGAVGGSLASSAHEWLLQRLGAVVAQRGIAAVALGRCVLRPWHLESASARAAARAAGVIQIYSRPEYSWKLSIRNDSLTPSVTKGLAWPSQTPPSQAPGLWSREGFVNMIMPVRVVRAPTRTA